MASVIDVYVDLRNRKLVSGQNVAAIGGGGDWTFPKVWHNENLNIRWHFLQQNTVGDLKNPNSLVPVSGAALTVTVFDITGATPLASTLPVDWHVDAGSNTLYGELDLNTGPMGTAFSGSTVTIQAYLELQLVLADGLYAFRFVITIDKSFIAAAAPASITPAGYMTREEVLAMFVKYFGNADGLTITLLSPDGSHQRIIGVRDDGSAQDDIV